MDLEPTNIAVRGHLVVRSSALRRRRVHRDRARAQKQASAPKGHGGAIRQPDQRPEKPILSPEEEQAACVILGPRPWLSLTFDAETIVAPQSPSALLRTGQPLRVAYFELRGTTVFDVARRLAAGTLQSGDRHRLMHAGFVVPDRDEEIIVAGELLPLYEGHDLQTDVEAIEEYVDLNRYRGEYKDLTIVPKQTFIRNVLYYFCYNQPRGQVARLVGHNLFYDLTRLISDSAHPDGTLIPGVRQGGRWARGGFSLKLCDCPVDYCAFHPRIRIKKLGRFKHRYAFSKRDRPLTGGGWDTRKDRTAGHFLDTLPFGLALRKGKSGSLEAMAQDFGAQVQKLPHPDFAGAITDDYLSYLVADVQATYWLSVAELRDYSALAVSKRAESVYSTASLAKGYQQDFGFPTTRQRQFHLALPELGYVAADVNGFAMSTYFGGRSEVRYRSAPVETIHLDFKSDYVAGTDLMGLQRFALAQEITARDCTRELQSWLSEHTSVQVVDELRHPATWKSLCVLVQVKPTNATLPVRSNWGGALNIGQQIVSSQIQLWWPLADILAAYIRDGVAQDILQAIEFVPSASQVATKPLTIAGRVVDPQSVNIWTEFINIRRQIKREMKAAIASGNAEEAARLDAQQHALKEAALAGTYGILEELNEHIYQGKALTLDIYALGHTKRLGNIVEVPGSYFAGALGTFIPAGGRLLLALVEQLLIERGLSYCFMDTDSVTAIRPEGMERREFYRRVEEVVEYFSPLNPYEDGGSLLAYEDQNYAVDPDNPNAVTSALEPLYCIATSAKRYVEFNIRMDPETGVKIPVLRKFTTHGLGAWGPRVHDSALPQYMHPPITYRVEDGTRVPDSRPLGGPLWLYRLQWEFVYTLLNDRHPDGTPLYHDPMSGDSFYLIPFDDTLDDLAFTQFSIETWADYQRVKHLAGVRPGGFLTIYPDPSLGYPRVEVAESVLSTDANTGPAARLGGSDAAGSQSETLMNRSSSALYSPFVSTGAEAHEALCLGRIRRVGDDTVVAADEGLATVYSRVKRYFTHGEAKAANPFGIGRLERRHMEVVAVEVIGKESHTLAQAAVEDTAGLLGSAELLRSQSYGNAIVLPTATSHRQLSALLDEPIPDLLAASCLSRSTLSSLLHDAHKPDEETLEALRTAMRLLDPDGRCPSIAGWRELLTLVGLADALGVSIEESRLRFRGRVTWTEGERARLLVHMLGRGRDDASTGVLDIRLLVGVPFILLAPAEANMTGLTYALQLLDANDTKLMVRDLHRIIVDYPPHEPVRITKQNSRFSLEPVSSGV